MRLSLVTTGLLAAATWAAAPAPAGADTILGIHVDIGHRHGPRCGHRGYGPDYKYGGAYKYPYVVKKVVPGYAYGYAPAYQRYDPYRIGFDRGYSDGVKEGIDDGRRRRAYEFWREGDYRHADSGYRSEYGPRDAYRDGYRDGFEDGYRRGYEGTRASRYDRYDRDERYEYDRGGYDRRGWDDRR